MYGTKLFLVKLLTFLKQQNLKLNAYKNASVLAYLAFFIFNF